MVESEHPGFGVDDPVVPTGFGHRQSPVVLSDDAVVLRPWTTTDASFLVEASRDAEIQRYNGPGPTSVTDAVAMIERIEQSWRAFAVEGNPTGVAFVIVDVASGEPVGMCGIDQWSSTTVAQFGYWLASGARGRGFATRAAALMTGWLFGVGAARVFLTIRSENVASAAVARRAGFSFEGTLRADGVLRGQGRDMDVFAVLPDEWASRSVASGRETMTAPEEPARPTHIDSAGVPDAHSAAVRRTEISSAALPLRDRIVR